MSAVIALAWPFVALVALSLVGVWVFIIMPRASYIAGLDARLSEHRHRTSERLDEQENLAKLNGHGLEELKQEMAKRLEKVEAELGKAAPRAVASDPKARLAPFR